MNLENPIPACPSKVKSAPRDEGPHGQEGAAGKAAKRGKPPGVGRTWPGWPPRT